MHVVVHDNRLSTASALGQRALGRLLCTQIPGSQSPQFVLNHPEMGVSRGRIFWPGLVIFLGLAWSQSDGQTVMRWDIHAIKTT